MAVGKTNCGGSGGGGSGANLLDNWYFLSPINQRGSTSYAGNRYGIDRWLSTNSYLTVNVTSSGLQLVTTSEGYLCQRFEAGLYRGQTLTATILFSDGTYKTGTADTPTEDSELVYFDETYPKMSFSTTSEYDQFRIDVPDNTTITIVAVKLECGSSQSLAKYSGSVWKVTEIPNYYDQLTRCQFWFYRTRTNNANEGLVFCPAWSAKNATGLFPFPAMRTTPTVSTGNSWQLVGNVTKTITKIDVNYVPYRTFVTLDFTVSSGLTVGNYYSFSSSSAGAVLDFSAEL